MSSNSRSKYTLFPTTSANEAYWLKSVVVIGFAFAFVMTLNLWLNVRSYPLVPAIAGLPPIGHPLDWILLAAELVLLVCIFIAQRPRAYIWVFLGILAILCLYDQTRWQPYVFQYAFLFAALTAYSWRNGDAKSRLRALNIARLIIVCTYIYSGLQKINPGFFGQVWPWITQPLTHAYPLATEPILLFGYLAPFIQIAFGLGLLSKRFRKPAVVFAVLMHCFILAMIGPWALDWNSVVWPWTVAMAFFDVILFGGADDFSYQDVFSPGNSILHWVVLILFAVMPIFSFFNLWDSDLSAALYSGNLTEGYIHVSDIGMSELPTDIQQYAAPDGQNDNILPIKNWALGDMNAIEYPETRVFTAIAKSVCSQMTDPTQLVLVVDEARLFRSAGEVVYHCDQM